MRKSLALVLLVVLIGACTPGVPDDQRLEAMFRDHLLSDGLGDLFSMDKFVKTNGFRQSENVYIASVEYDLVFQKSFFDVVREIREDPTGPQYGLFGSKLLITAIQSNFGQFETGDRIHKIEKITLHNTEQGWQLAE
jgi:hypothetical protein